VKASAPGKIILFGEHAVVYGRPAVAVPVTQVRAEVEVSRSHRPGIWIDAPDVALRAELKTLPIDHPLAALMHRLLSTLRQDPHPDLQITITSSIPVASGLGSGAAVSVALIRAISAALDYPLSDGQVNEYAYEVEKLHHGTPSGIDNTVVTFAKPVFFVKGKPVEMLRVGAPFTVVIGATGVPAPTRESVGDVRRLLESSRAKVESVFDEIGEMAREARTRIEDGNWQQLGILMDQNQALLEQLGVSAPELDRLISAARSAGALGAKLSGGGRGGNMIALVPEGAAKEIAEALTSAGSPRVIVTLVEPASSHVLGDRSPSRPQAKTNET
jgi:mevalonate kinase